MNKYKRIMDAVYDDSVLDDYKGNPFIEALPPVLNTAELYERIIVPIKFDESERELSKAKRIQSLGRLKELFIPSDMHDQLYNMLCRVIHNGYKYKNPFSADEIRRKFTIRRKRLNKNVNLKDYYADENLDQSQVITTSGMCLFGISGSGKTTAINKILNLFPQVIKHTEYKGRPLLENQVVYIKIECPTDGSVKTLCNAFYNELDNIIDDAEYYRLWGGEKRGTMVQNMPNAALLENVGLIVIDEIQHLVRTPAKTKELVDFLVEVINTIQVPMLFIGTNKAYEVMQNNIRGPRRISGDGFINWQRITEKEDWDIFINSIWNYQWTKYKVPLTQGLKDAMYEHSQGIADFAIKLFMFAQANAIYSDFEKIDENIIKKTAEKDLALTKKMRDAIKSGNREEMLKYEDILSFSAEEMLNEKSLLAENEERIKKSASLDRELLQKQKDEIYLYLFERMQILAAGETNLLRNCLGELLKTTDITKPLDDIERDAQAYFMKRYRDKIIQDTSKKKQLKRSAQDSITFGKADLRSAPDTAKNEHKDVYAVLYDKGYIKPPLEFIKNNYAV